MDNNNGQEQSTKVVEMAEKTADKAVKKGKGAENKLPAAPQGPQQKMYLISEQAVNQLLNTVAELPGLTWKQTNPIIQFIQQNVSPFQG